MLSTEELVNIMLLFGGAFFAVVAIGWFIFLYWRKKDIAARQRALGEANLPHVMPDHASAETITLSGPIYQVNQDGPHHHYPPGHPSLNGLDMNSPGVGLDPFDAAFLAQQAIDLALSLASGSADAGDSQSYSSDVSSPDFSSSDSGSADFGGSFDSGGGDFGGGDSGS